MILISIFTETTQVCFPGGSDGKEPTCNAGDPISILGSEDPLEEEMEALPVFLSGEFPRTEEPAGLQTVGSQDLDTT